MNERVSAEFFSERGRLATLAFMARIRDAHPVDNHFELLLERQQQREQNRTVVEVECLEMGKKNAGFLLFPVIRGVFTSTHTKFWL